MVNRDVFRVSTVETFGRPRRCVFGMIGIIAILINSVQVRNQQQKMNFKLAGVVRVNNLLAPESRRSVSKICF